MQPVLLALVLAAVLLHVPLVSPAALREKAAAERRGSGRGKRADSYVSTRRFPLKLTRRRSVHRDDMGQETTNFVSIFDLRRKQILCEEHYRDQQNPDGAGVACLLGDLWFVLGSRSGPAWRTNQVSPSLSSSPRRNLPVRHLLSRRRRADRVNPSVPLRSDRVNPSVPLRSDRVNPSDPLRSESHPGNPAHGSQDPEVSEQDQAGAVSKETITSCDDPLKVLHSVRPISPIKTSIAERADHD
ncbi:uncharacterized protein LOC130389595 isoform X2 [Gadus chalcogrammus]|uniref:uncharacterized protein LOC130389595 isoform X2 n=1 Tax=Gadus chalcogrammus TaxID=1042646 RepID=UPI0024C4C43B|nr:uncharacterized protein LOC130389595 isoform X2 [Gadus chalcogrammus]